ncbi:MAG: hypothetical protein HQ559_15665 [Lentisphaerae bacterium]|nr:hypothetical protein [Lentisphaerota bacterium]
MNEQIVELELRVLILKYGRQRVLRALARLDEQPLEEIEKRLRELEAKPKKKRTKRSVMDVLDAVCREHPEIAEPLRALGVRFENRTFLPQLRDVQRFLDRSTVTHGKLKSRNASAPVLFRALAGLSRDELIRLNAAEANAEDGSYEMLARAIMGKHAKPGSDSAEGDRSKTEKKS